MADEQDRQPCAVRQRILVPDERDRHPVTLVGYEDALAYCAWLPVLLVSHAQYASASSYPTSVTGWRSRPSGGVPLVQKYLAASNRNSASSSPETITGKERTAGERWPVSRTNCAYSAFVTGQVPMQKSSRYALCAGRSSSSPSSAPMANSPAGIRATCSMDRSAIFCGVLSIPPSSP